MSYFKKRIPNLHSVAALSLLLLWSNISIAQLSNFHANYSIKWDLGISLSGKAERSLIKSSDGSYLLTTKASAMFASLTESSQFRIVNDQIEPQHYRYQRKVLNKTRDMSVAFDWLEKKVKNTAQSSSWVMDIEPNTLDKQSVQLRLQLDLAASPAVIGTIFSYQVADGGLVKTYRFMVDGEDLIKTPMGTYKSLRIKRDRGDATERETWVWFAPELDYTMVRILQKETDGKRYELNLTDLAR